MRDDARLMGTKHKTPAVLDAMIEHIRYEVMQVVQFGVFGNGWCDLLRPDLGGFVQRSTLEASLIHFRSLIEFLGEQPTGDQVLARDYLEDWDWKIGEQLGEVWQLHGRVAHLGTVRCSVGPPPSGRDTPQIDGDFSWLSWLTDEAPVVLRGFRDFLMQLRDSSPHRYQLFVQPRDDLPIIDLLPLLDSVVMNQRR